MMIILQEFFVTDFSPAIAIICALECGMCVYKWDESAHVTLLCLQLLVLYCQRPRQLLANQLMVPCITALRSYILECEILQFVSNTQPLTAEICGNYTDIF